MGILIDSRVGSKHLQPLIPHSELTQLDSADAAFGTVDGRLVGIEVKKVNDAVQCLYSGRLADEQVPKMKAQYDICYLVVQGTYRADPDSGVLQLWREFDSSKPTKCGQWYDVSSGVKRLTYKGFEAWLTSMEHLGGIHVRTTADDNTTAALVMTLYTWFQREDHASFDTMHIAEGASATLRRPTLLRRFLALMPHVGWDRSEVLAKRFRSIADAVNARRDAWLIEGQIAEKSVNDIRMAIHGETD